MVRGRTQAVIAQAKRTSTSSSGKKPPTSTAGVSSPNVSGRNSRKPNAATALPSCGGCGILISDSVNSLQCDRCRDDQWKCIDCLNLTNEVYNQLMSDPSCSLKWFCESCDKVITRLDMDSLTAAVTSCISPVLDKCIVMFKDIEHNILQQMATIEQRLDEFKQTCDTLQSGPNVAASVDSFADKLKTMEHSLATKVSEVETNLGQKVDLDEVKNRKFSTEFAMMQDMQIRVEEKVDAVLTKMVSKCEAEGDVQDAHERIEQKVDALAAGVEKSVVASDSVKEIVSGTLEEDRAEQEELQKRKTSIIIHGLLEPQSSIPEERRQEDEATIEHLLHSLNLDDVSVNSVIRLGKRPE